MVTLHKSRCPPLSLPLGDAAAYITFLEGMLTRTLFFFGGDEKNKALPKECLVENLLSGLLLHHSADFYALGEGDTECVDARR